MLRHSFIRMNGDVVGHILDRFHIEASDLLTLSETCKYVNIRATELLSKRHTLLLQSKDAVNAVFQTTRWDHVRSLGFVGCTPVIPRPMTDVRALYLERCDFPGENIQTFWKTLLTEMCPSLERLHVHHQTTSLTHDIVVRHIHTLAHCVVPRLKDIAFDFAGPYYYFCSETESERSLRESHIVSNCLESFHNRTQWPIAIDAPLKKLTVREKGLSVIGPKAEHTLHSLTWYDVGTNDVEELARFTAMKHLEITIGSRLFQEEVGAVLHALGSCIPHTLRTLKIDLPLSIFGRDHIYAHTVFEGLTHLEHLHIIVSHATPWIKDIFSSRFFGICSPNLKHVIIQLRRGQAIIDLDTYKECMRHFPSCRCEVSHISIAGSMVLE